MLVCAEQDPSFDAFTNPETLLQAVLSAAWLKAATTSFLKRESDIDRQRKVVGVVQKESARVALLDEPDIVLSSNSATTCVIAVAVCHHSGYASVAHFDEGVATRANFVQWLRDMTHPDVYLVGDFALPTESRVRIELHCHRIGRSVVLGIGIDIGEAVVVFAWPFDDSCRSEIGMCARGEYDGGWVSCCLRAVLRLPPRVGVSRRSARHRDSCVDRTPCQNVVSNGTETARRV